MRAERLSTDFPFVSLTLFSMTDKIACSDFSSCRTLLIGAKELRRIFLGFCVLHTFTAYPLMRFFPTQWEILPPDKGALPKIDAQAKSISDLLSNKKYTTDYYQREYKWEKRQIEELLEDLEAKFLDHYEEEHARSEVENYRHYFLGSMIVSNRDGKKFIVDGQQRLTSITLVLIHLHHLQFDRP